MKHDTTELSPSNSTLEENEFLTGSIAQAHLANAWQQDEEPCPSETCGGYRHRESQAQTAGAGC